MATISESKKHHLSINHDWTLSIIKEFIEVLMDITLCNDVQDLKDHIFLKCVWKEMENKLSINSNTLKNFWLFRLHLQLFCVEPIYLNDIKIKLIEHFHKKKIKSRCINWSNVLLFFDGYTHKFLYSVFNNLIRLARFKTKSMKFKDHINYLYTTHIPFLIESSEDRILPRLSYNKGNIIYKDTDLEEAIEFKQYIKTENEELN